MTSEPKEQSDSVDGLGPSRCYTPGPWSAGKWKGEDVVFWDEGNGTIPIAIVDDWVARGSSEANARLIAAAPDLLEACIAVVHAAESDNETGNCDIYGEVSTCIDAIKKATGG